MSYAGWEAGFMWWGELEILSLEERKLKRKSDLNYEQAIIGRYFLPPSPSFPLMVRVAISISLMC